MDGICNLGQAVEFVQLHWGPGNRNEGSLSHGGGVVWSQQLPLEGVDCVVGWTVAYLLCPAPNHPHMCEWGLAEIYLFLD